MNYSYLVKDLMTPDPITVKPLDLVETVLQRLEASHVSGLPIINDDSSKRVVRLFPAFYTLAIEQYLISSPARDDIRQTPLRM